MATEGGPKLVSDGLVLALDAANDKSFRGEPTTNVVTNWDLNTGWSKGYTEDIIFNEIPPPVGVDAPTVGFRNDDSGGQGFWYSYGDYAPQDPNTTYTISIYAKTNQTNGNFRIQAYTANNSETGRQFTSLAYITQPNIWQRLSWTITTPSNTQSDSLSFRYYGLYDGGYTRLWLCAPQMEANTKATRFVKGTRGTTVATGGGWADRSGNNNHGELVNGPTFDNDNLGGIEFDGVDDSIVLPNPGVTSSTGFSIELILKPVNFSSSPMIITPLSGGIDHYIRFSSNGTLYLRVIPAADSSSQNFSTTTSLSSNKYHHVVFTFKQSEGGKAFYNGNLESSAPSNFTALNWAGTWRVGQRGNNTFFYEGNIAMLNTYNRVLTPQEVLQNYNATKSRFNL